MKLEEIYRFFDELAPFDTALSFDNAGILVGGPEREVSAAVVCLDVTEPVVEEAVAKGAELIISHHPVLFHGIKQIPSGGLIESLIRNGLCVLSAHTNLDIATPGVNYWLAEACGFDPASMRKIPEDPARQADGSGLAGTLPEPMSASAFAEKIRELLGADRIKFTDTDRPIRTVAFCCGSGAFLLPDVIRENTDALVTAEIKHHELIEAKSAGICAIDAGHYETEHLLVAPLCKLLSDRFPGIRFFPSEREQNPASYR